MIDPGFNPKDFVQTAEGLLFAVVVPGLEQGRVRGCLRYIQEGGTWRKYPTVEANLFLRRFYPEYLYFSHELDTVIHAVSIGRIEGHYQPKVFLQNILHASVSDPVLNDAQQLLRLFQDQAIDMRQLGITGSLLVGAQTASSDIDLVSYGLATFQDCQASVSRLIQQNVLQALDNKAWQETYRRRESSLNYEEYVWHEQRKNNKALVNGRKFDLSYVDRASVATEKYQKLGSLKLQATVIDDSRAFAYPAELVLDHPEIKRVVSFTATYCGQARVGEQIEASGWIEQSSSGQRRLVVGSSREAFGEYIKVVAS